MGTAAPLSAAVEAASVGPARLAAPGGDRAEIGPATVADVSVVIPVLNEASWLPRLLDSIEAQTVGVAEVIVVDAGSFDGTVAVARARGATVVEGGGLPGFSRNLGAERASSEWLLFLDADVRLPPTAVEVMLSQMERGRLDAASTAFAPDGDRLLVQIQHRLSSWYFRASARVGWPHSIGAFLFVRRTLHHRIGGFDSGVTVAEDQDYVVRLSRVGRYRFARRPVVEIAQRRFDDRGFWAMSLTWLAIEAHRMVLGEIRHDHFAYFR